MADLPKPAALPPQPLCDSAALAEKGRAVLFDVLQFGAAGARLRAALRRPRRRLPEPLRARADRDGLAAGRVPRRRARVHRLLDPRRRLRAAERALRRRAVRPRPPDGDRDRGARRPRCIGILPATRGPLRGDRRHDAADAPWPAAHSERLPMTPQPTAPLSSDSPPAPTPRRRARRRAFARSKARCEQFARAYLRDRRSERRWRIFFRLLWLLVCRRDRLGHLRAAPPRHRAERPAHRADRGARRDRRRGRRQRREPRARHCKSAFEDAGAQAVVLRINSPGGSPVQAGIINDEIRRLKASCTTRSSTRRRGDLRLGRPTTSPSPPTRSTSTRRRSSARSAC